VIDWTLLATIFGVIFVAEVPDKTALAALVLATRYRAWPVFLGTAFALTIQSVVAIAAGKLLSLLPARPVHVGAGILFLASAVVMWRRHEALDGGPGGEGQRAPPTFARLFASTFGVVFIAEWGDLTQLATAALAARYRKPLTVFLGATLALWVVAAIAVFVGHRAGRMLNPDLTTKIAAVVFAVLGVALLSGLI
jgi:putative Ca2+/H+ antiporter (TMEM165/GDT1 family)